MMNINLISILSVLLFVNNKTLSIVLYTKPREEDKSK